MRAAWIATVANIDWPKAETIGIEETQRIEMISLLDSLKSLGFNAVIFQVRPTADALYRSELEPRSRWIGQGMYDPLEFVVEEAHRRQMEVHAWVNPYRITLKDHALYKPQGGEVYPIYLAHPEWLMRYGGQYFFNPAIADCREWIADVVEDIVCRYEVDAIHMDDYFYPYPVPKEVLPDSKHYKADPRGFADIADWRRDNVNLTIQLLSSRIRMARPGCRFGISPFGINEKNYTELYADVELWLREGWIDYVAPQLYWPIGHKTADYERLMNWWADHSHGRALYIGLADYRFGGPELMRQIRLNRTRPEVGGECFYSTRPLLKNKEGICDSLRVCGF